MKKIKESDWYQKFKELWSNKKTHSLIVLCFWLIFIVAAFIFVRVSSTTTNYTPEENNEITLSDIKNYEFRYVTSTNEYDGQAYDEKMLFYLNNHQYYVNENVYLVSDTLELQQNFDLNVMKINITMLNELLADLTYSEVDGGKQYLVPLNKFIEAFEGTSDSNALNYNIVITLFGEDTINKITMDISNYVIFKTGQTQTYLVTLYLYNVNNVTDFTSEYDKMIGVE